MTDERQHTPEMTLRRLQVVADAGFVPRPDAAHVQDVRDAVADLTALRASLLELFDQATRPRLVRRQNDAWCETYDRAAKLLGKPGSMR